MAKKLMAGKTGNHNADIPSREIRVWLDEYDDIFSDFDPRPYSDRVLSDDFIGELTKVSRESETAVNELKLLIPEQLRNGEIETIISKRLHSYFRKNFTQMRAQRTRTIFTSTMLLFMGFALMVICSYISPRRSDDVGLNLLFVILEPAGWFFVWTGLDETFNGLKKKKAELNFFSGMVKSKISFLGTGAGQAQKPSGSKVPGT